MLQGTYMLVGVLCLPLRVDSSVWGRRERLLGHYKQAAEMLKTRRWRKSGSLIR
jgi:hypothetical protein